MTEEEAREHIDMLIAHKDKALKTHPYFNRCDSCTHSEEQDGSNCYECIKGMADNFEAQPSEDCISRQAVDDAVYDYSRSCDVNYEQIMEFIDKLPPVKPQYTDEEIDKAQAVEQAYVDKMVELAVEEAKRPRGKWIITYPDGAKAFKCNQCNKYADIYHATNYCPTCGAEMSGGEKDANCN